MKRIRRIIAAVLLIAGGLVSIADLAEAAGCSQLLWNIIYFIVVIPFSVMLIEPEVPASWKEDGV